MKKKLLLSIIILGYLLCACGKPKLESEILTFEYNEKMYSRVISKLPGSAELIKDFSPSEQLILSDQTIADFNLIDANDFSDESSAGLILTGECSINGIQIRKEMEARIQSDFPDFVITQVKYTNTGTDTLIIIGWTNNSYSVLPSKNITPAFWSFQGAAPDLSQRVLYSLYE